MIHVHVLYMIYFRVYVHDTCPCICTWYKSTYMYMLHVHVYVHDTCPRICKWYMSTYKYMIHVCVHVHDTCPRICACRMKFFFLYSLFKPDISTSYSARVHGSISCSLNTKHFNSFYLSCSKSMTITRSSQFLGLLF